MTRNEIFTNLRTAVKAVSEGANCIQAYSVSPTVWPTVLIREIGRYTPPATVTMSNSQDISVITWEMQIYSNLQTGAKEEAYAILDAAKSAFRSMGFAEIMETPVDTNDASYYRLAARFRRILGSGD